jgi:F5/8 type C domain
MPRLGSLPSRVAWAVAGAITPFTTYQAPEAALGGGAGAVSLTSAPTSQYDTPQGEAGSYTVSFRVAAPSAVTDAFHITDASGNDLTGEESIPANAVDGNTSSYWESTDNAFPQWFQVDLGSSASVGRIVMDLPPSTTWGTRTQTITIQGSTDGSSYSS